jgi:hypothetical protein
MAMSGAQLIRGMTMKDPGYEMSSGTDEAIKIGRGMANQTQAAGTDEAMARTKQTTSDRVNSAQRTFSDPNKVASQTNAAYRDQLAAVEKLDVAAQQERLQGQQQLTSALGKKSMEEAKQKADFQAQKSNMTGAGIEGLLSGATDYAMIGAQSDIMAGKEVDTSLPGQGTGWLNKKNKTPTPTKSQLASSKSVNTGNIIEEPNFDTQGQRMNAKLFPDSTMNQYNFAAPR